MVKVLLAVFLLGISFSSQAQEDECDLNEGMVRVSVSTFSSSVLFEDREYGYSVRRSALEIAKTRALDKCRTAGYSKCKFIKSWFTWYNDYFKHARAYAQARGEMELELTGEKRKRRLCSNINQCIGNGKGSYEQLEALFKLNKCPELFLL